MKKILLFIILFYSIGTYSQNAQDIIDKLKIELKSKPDAKKTATIYSDLTWYYANISTDSALAYGQKAIVESVKLKDSVLLSQIYSDLGAVYFRKTDYKLSKENFLKSYQIRKIRNDKIGMAKVAANLGNIYSKENKKTAALKSYLESIDYFQKTNNLEAVALTNANIGSLFLDLKNYTKSLNYTKKAIAFQEDKKYDVGLSTSYLTMGNIYLRLKDTLKALKFYSKSITSSKKTGNNVALAAALNNISNIKIVQNKNEEATKLIVQSGKIIQQLNVNSDESSLHLNMAAKDISNKKFIEAKQILYKLKKQYSGFDNHMADLNQTYLYLSQISAYMNNPDSASFYISQSLKLQNEIIEKTVQKQTNEFETKYQTAKKEKQLLQNEIEIKNAKNRLIATFALTILISLIGFLIYRQQKLKNKQQNQEFELKTAISKIETQNKLQDQRLTISRDLHDNIGAQLTFIISSVDNIKYAFDLQNSKLDDKLQKISSFTKDTIVELRDTIWAMNNNAISFDELRSRILNFIEKAKFAKENIHFKFNIDENLNEIELTSIVGMNIYRTIQEAVNNAIKYANATEIVINATKTNTILITIQDNGIGFDLENVQKGNGLLNMQKRMEDINGICNFESNKNGTIIKIEIN